ncbi:MULTISPECIES: LCI fold-containing protein [unclassified Bacillus (in: firmicutes)]|uniref:LCI fold-containing protein n=1 Tax=unclassified Bacillus (in: firmicutes) TaxID=185979 RepID=UPI0030103209
MFKKLVVGTLATGIALTGGIGSASASTEGVENTKQVAPIVQEIKVDKNYSSTNNEFNFTYTWDPGRQIYKTYDFYRHDGVFASYFESEGIKWYFKGKVQVFSDGSALGHYEGRK